MSPGKLATWRDPAGNDRLLVVEPGRADEYERMERRGQIIAPVRRPADQLQ